MNISKMIRKQIITMVSNAINHRIRPDEVECRIASKFGISISTVKDILNDLIRKQELVLTYRQPWNYVEIPAVEMHKAARPMRVVVDAKGESWICDSDVDPSKDLSLQGCWRCGEMTFTRDD